MFKILSKVFKAPGKAHVKDEDIRKIPEFIFLKYIGTSPYAIQAAVLFNRYYNIPITEMFKVTQQAFGGKVGYVSYPKMKKDNSKIYEIIARHYKINLTKAKEYVQILPKQELDKILKIYERR